MFPSMARIGRKVLDNGEIAYIRPSVLQSVHLSIHKSFSTKSEDHLSAGTLVQAILQAFRLILQDQDSSGGPSNPSGRPSVPSDRSLDPSGMPTDPLDCSWTPPNGLLTPFAEL